MYTEDKFKLKTTDIAPSITSLSEGQRTPTKAAIMKTDFIQEGNSTKLRKYFELTRNDLSKADRKGGVQGINPDLASLGAPSKNKTG